MGAFWDAAWSNAFGTVIGGTVLSAIFFVLKEYIFQRPQVTGIWECQMTTLDTQYAAHKGMHVWYQVTLLQNGDKIIGFGEKDRESAAGGRRTYSGANRCPIEISGFIEKNYLSSDKVHLSWYEHGALRKSSSVFQLRISGSKSTGCLVGGYQSTIASSSGRAKWCRRS